MGDLGGYEKVKLCYNPNNMFNFKELKDEMAKVEEWLRKEFSLIRTGRAAPAILDHVLVEAYGSKMVIRELASVSVEDPKTIRIEPWDKSQSKAIEKSLQEADLGISINVDEKGLRVIFPELTSERREQFAKIIKNKLEEARISIRGARDKTWEEIQQKEKQGGMGEDDKFRLKDEMQKIIDEANKKMEEMAEKKETEIKS